MAFAVFIDGAAGTTGIEIADRLADRTDISLITLDHDQRKDVTARRQALNDADLAILCLPDDAAREAITLIENDRTRVIDASTAHRVADGWCYGLPELEPDSAARIAESSRVSNPGCYPTGFLGLVRPLIRAGIIPHDWPISVSAVSGYSGGGKTMIAEFQSGSSATAYRAYALNLAHKHVAEMQKHGRLALPPIFAPAVANVFRGMIVEVPLPLSALPRRPSLSACRETLQETYRDSPLVHVETETDASVIMIEADAGTDRLTLRVFGDPADGQARLIATLDNLGKGASGAAVQNLNIMAGFDPLCGLVL